MVIGTFFTLFVVPVLYTLISRPRPQRALVPELDEEDPRQGVIGFLH
jgi:hypothetical protein